MIESKTVSLKDYSTMRVGGRAQLLVPENSQELALILERESKFLVIGSASNILFPDHDLDFPVIKLGEKFSAGMSLTRLINKYQAKGLSGLEFAAGVPATLGGAVISNLGALGHDIAEIVDQVEALTLKGRAVSLFRRDLSFAYRKTNLKNLIITEVFLKLRKDEPQKIEERIKKNILKRRETQPLDYPSLGSVFKNPVGDKKAWQLIDEVGMRGKRVGDAQVSEKHANWIINLGKAKSEDVKALITEIQERVKKEKEIDLELEIRLL